MNSKQNNPKPCASKYDTKLAVNTDLETPYWFKFSAA